MGGCESPLNTLWFFNILKGMNSTREQGPDFQNIFQSTPDCYLILLPDAPRFTIVAVNDAYLHATNTIREKILGKPLFEVFPDNPKDLHATGVRNLGKSLATVIATKADHFMAIQKYDIRRPDENTTDFEERYWLPHNSPVFDAQGEITYIIHRVIDVTENEKLIHTYGGEEIKEDEVDYVSQAKRLEHLMVGRELRIIELKEEIRQLKARPEGK